MAALRMRLLQGRSFERASCSSRLGRSDGLVPIEGLFFVVLRSYPLNFGLLSCLANHHSQVFVS